MRTKLKIAVLVVAAILTALSSFGASAHDNAQADKQSANQSAPTQKRLDPAGWGSNHVGKPLPEYVPGDECLFCHRSDIGPNWQKNSHRITVRQREDALELQDLVKTQTALVAFAPQVDYFLGSRHRIRFLKKEGYGKFALLSTQVEMGQDKRAQKWIELEKPSWDKDRFSNRCAGCHTTAVDTSTKAFSAFGIDCYACHGVVDLNHTADTSLIFLSKKRRSDARAITATCAQCHLRTGKARSTGLPYPNNFVAGDNLFQDFEVDFSKADDESLNAGDRHILRNVRDVALYGSEFPTCISCHDVHKQSSAKHHRAPRTAICSDCHNAEGPIKGSKPFAVHSALCEY
jgi:hypothetical protein